MRIEIKGLAALRDRLARAHPAEIIAQRLETEAEKLATTVRESLGEPAGAGSHDKPWARTGALRDSIAASADGLQASVGSNDPAAAPQEMGTHRIPPRPFLAPAAAAAGQQIAASIGKAVAASLKGDQADV